MTDPFDPDVYASEADYRAGRRCPNGADHADVPPGDEKRAWSRKGAADDDLGGDSNHDRASLRPHTGADSQVRRCLACQMPTAKPWHRLCRSCWAWYLAGQHLRAYVHLLHRMREVRT